MSCQDCLIWVGKAYRTIEMYVSEAEERGCSRRVPALFNWVVPGETRVFLAHHDGYTRRDKGVIFGYFELAGVDVIVPEGPTDPPPESPPEDPPESPPGSPPVKPPSKPHGNLPDEFSDIPVLGRDPAGARPAEQPTCGISVLQTGLEASRLCGLRLRSGGGADVRGGTPREAKAPRPALYFVDALTRKIDELFSELLEEYAKEELLKGKTGQRKGRTPTVAEAELRQARPALLKGLREQASKKLVRARQMGAPQFSEAVRQAEAPGVKWVELSKKLARVAVRRGALVVFKKPCPPFQKAPRAEFLGVLRLDGNELMENIYAFYDKKGAGDDVHLPYCDGSDRQRAEETGVGEKEKAPPGVGGKTGGGVKKGQLVVEMARGLDVSKALSGKVLDWLTRRITEELQGDQTFTLRNVGTFRIGKKGGRHVAFRPSKTLTTAVTEARRPEGKKAGAAKAKGKK